MNDSTIDSSANSSRSPLMMNRYDTAMLVVDVQEKLLPHVSDQEEMMWNIGRLIKGAKLLDVPAFATEQYPKGLGKTVTDVSDVLDNGHVHEKLMFSCRECDGLIEQMRSSEIKNVLLVGVETHVCVMQSAFDLMAAGFEVFIGIDAVGSRFEEDYMTAMQRLETAGAVLVTTEMALFEWCEKAGSPEFKKISRIVQEQFVSDEDPEEA